MNKALFVLLALILAAGGLPVRAQVPAWTQTQLDVLEAWAHQAPDDARPRPDANLLAQARARSDPSAADSAATALALRLARMHLLGIAPAGQRAGWRIVDAADVTGLEGRLASALAADELDGFFKGLRPDHPDYAALRAAYGQEPDVQRRATLARNMERWRWMPRSLGESYVLVNAASFEVSLWRHGARAGTWPVIVGKPSTPTPVFSATITGAILNPWWEIPASIVRESVGALVRRNPALARQRGYVWSGGVYRQRPGPGNALGQMKLVMPNPYNVYLHDTPSKHLFGRDVRAFSHGCIRVGDAIGFAATLAQGARTRAEVDAIVASGRTTEVSFASPIPVYVAYFTAATGVDGKVAFHPDIYGRDARIAAPVERAALVAPDPEAAPSQSCLAAS